jgi:LysR family transcriptional regulator, regulator of abg operon
MRITQLRDFLAVADAGSIRGAARALDVTQPAVTRSIRQLEAEFQVRLLERSGKGVTPTANGRAFLARARAVYREMERMREEQAQFAGISSGSVAFGASPQAMIHLVPRALEQFRREHAYADVRIVDGLAHVLLPQLREGSLDFVIGSRPQGGLDARFTYQPLFTNQIVVGARRGHGLRNAKSLAELVDAQWVIFTPSGWAGAMIPEMFVKNGLRPPKSVVRSDSYLAFLSILAATDMVAPLSRMLLQQPLARPLFEEFKLKERLPEFSIGLFRLADSPFTPAADGMAAAIRAAARRLAFKK